MLVVPAARIYCSSVPGSMVAVVAGPVLPKNISFLPVNKMWRSTGSLEVDNLPPGDSEEPADSQAQTGDTLAPRPQFFSKCVISDFLVNEFYT